MTLTLKQVTGLAFGEPSRWGAEIPFLILFCGQGCRHDLIDEPARQIHVMCSAHGGVWCAHIRDAAPLIRLREEHEREEHER
jgi:hypothetical protein